MSVIVKGGGGENVTPEVTAQTPVITQILEGLVGKAQGANATADKILEGYSAYVGQELIEGTAKDASTMVDLLAATGCTKFAVDKITYSSRTGASNAISHSLGEVPKIALLLSGNSGKTSGDLYIAILFYDTTYTKSAYVYYANSLNSNAINPSTPTASKVYFTTETWLYFTAGVEYTLITMA